MENSLDSVPTYVYRDETDENSSLLQGDILKVEGQFKKFFKEFYPKINHPDNEEKYVMVLTQSCDLVKNKKRQPKLTHINVCLVRTLKAVTEKLIAEIDPPVINGRKLLQKNFLDGLKDKLLKLLNNTDQKTYFFLPKKSLFTEDMVAIIPLSFSFRTEHYDLLLQNRILGLKPEFQAKLGHIISQLYGRIGTPDLSDFCWEDKQTRNYIKNLLDDLNLTQVTDKSVIDYIIANQKNHSSIEEMIKVHETKKTNETFRPIKNELLQNISNKLVTLFENKNDSEIESLTKLDKKELCKKIKETLRQLEV